MNGDITVKILKLIAVKNNINYTYGDSKYSINMNGGDKILHSTIYIKKVWCAKPV